MPLPLIPLLVTGASLLVAGSKGVQAKSANREAAYINENAADINDDAFEEANEARMQCKKAIDMLGEAKLRLLDEHVRPFILEYSKIHNVELVNSSGIAELRKIRFDKTDIQELRKLTTMASSLLGGAAGGAFAGAVTAFGAYSCVMTLGTASTGAVIGGLSGAAATNATLAWLGGGALSAGGLGMTGGSMVLGGLVAGPALAVFGVIMKARADANLDTARSNLALAKKYRQEMETVVTLCDGIKKRVILFFDVMNELDKMFVPMVDEVRNIIFMSGRDYRCYTEAQRKKLSMALATLKAIKDILDTPLLTKDGSLTEASARIQEISAPLLKLQRVSVQKQLS